MVKCQFRGQYVKLVISKRLRAKFKWNWQLHLSFCSNFSLATFMSARCCSMIESLAVEILANSTNCCSNGVYFCSSPLAPDISEEACFCWTSTNLVHIIRKHFNGETKFQISTSDFCSVGGMLFVWFLFLILTSSSKTTLKRPFSNLNLRLPLMTKSKFWAIKYESYLLCYCIQCLNEEQDSEFELNQIKF